MPKIDNDKPKVLLVVNERGIVNFLKVKLELSGYRVDICSNGEECLDLVLKIMPDIILLDINLPGIDGFEVLRRLRKFSRIPVLILSGRHSVPQETEDTEALGFIRKPFDLDELDAQMKSLLQPV